MPPAVQPPPPPDFTEAPPPPSNVVPPAPASGYPDLRPAAELSILAQFSGMAAWSIGFGLLSILVPFFTDFYYPILPVIGLFMAVRAIQRGLLIGGVVGIILNVLGAFMSLIASGLIFR